MITLLLSAVVAIAPLDFPGASPFHARRLSDVYTGELGTCAEVVDLTQLGPAIAGELDRCYGRTACMATIARKFGKAQQLLLGSAHRDAEEFVIELRLIDASDPTLIRTVRESAPPRLDALFNLAKLSVSKVCALLLPPSAGEDLELTLPPPPPADDLELTLPPAPFVEAIPVPAVAPPPSPSIVSSEEALIDAFEPMPAPPAPPPVRIAPPPALPKPAPPRIAPKPSAPAPAHKPPLPPLALAPEPPPGPGVLPIGVAVAAGVATLGAAGSALATTLLRRGDSTLTIQGAPVHSMTRADAVRSNAWASATNTFLVAGALLSAGAIFLNLGGEEEPRP